MSEGETVALDKEGFGEISTEGINDDTSRISFTLTVLEEAADAHTQAINGYSFRVWQRRKMKLSDIL